MMEYSDFYDIATYGNDNWKGSFTEKEVACNAYDYWENFQWSKANKKLSDTIKYLVENLEEDIKNADIPEAEFWLDCIKTELNTEHK